MSTTCGGLSDDLTEMQHTHMDLITSSVHVHLDHDNCLEIVMLRGEGKDIEALAEMMTLKGVKHVKLHTLSPSRDYG
jgi:CopG family nickel-responsive transcriptional regulator